MWSFVLHKKNKQWIWLALDTTTQEIVVFMLVCVAATEQQVYGNRYQQFIGSVLCAIPISGLPMKKFSQNLGIKLLVKKVVKLI